uniref:Putative structural protein n=1 Tax=viral metagenome TaxID=1070528 RepID=A0A6M3IZ23_9ZZZZ
MKALLRLWVYSCLLLFFAATVFADNVKITDLVEETTPVTTDIMLMVDDPGGSPVSKKVQIGNLWKVPIGAATGTSLDLGGTTLFASRAITVDTGGVLNIALSSASGDDFTVDTTKLVVEGDTGNVGIGTSTPDGNLHIHKATAGTVTANANTLLVLENSTAAHLEFITPNTIADHGIVWTDPDGLAGWLAYSHATNEMSFYTNGVVTPDMVIDSSGNFGIGTATPDYPLCFSAAVGQKIGLYDGTSIGFGVQSNLLEIIGASSAVNFTFGYGTSGSLTRVVTIKGTGNVGIGTTTPVAGYSLNIKEPSTGYDAILIEDSAGDDIFTFRLDADDDGFLDINKGDGSAALRLYANGTSYFNGGNVGIGNAAPGYPLEVTGNAYFSANVSALSFTDRTPFFDGDAVTELKKVKNKDGHIDHSSLPEFAQKNISRVTINPVTGETTVEDEPGRDLGAMISILTKAVQQLTERIEAIEKK